MRIISLPEGIAYLAKASQPLKDIARVVLDTGMRPEEHITVKSPSDKRSINRTSGAPSDRIITNGNFSRGFNARPTMTSVPLEVSSVV